MNKIISTGLMTVLCGSLGAYAWTVPQHVVDLQSPQMLGYTEQSKEPIPILAPTLVQRHGDVEKPENPKTFTFQKTQSKLSLVDENQSRVEWATRYLQQNKLEVAETILMEGLFVDAYHPELLRLMAFIEDRRQAPEKALDLLKKVKMHQRQDSQYISFLGYIYQKTGAYDLARQQYFRLLEREPENAAWLLGLSIALESEGKRESALDAYKSLSDKKGVDPTIMQYAKERMLALKG